MEQKIQAMTRKEGNPQHFAYLPLDVLERAQLTRGDAIEVLCVAKGRILLRKVAK